MRTFWSKPAAILVVLTAVLVLSGCGDSPTSPGIQPEIVNQTDNFQYQVTGVQNHSATHSYTWENTGTQATINQSCGVSNGTVTLVILDADGNQIYSRSLAENGTFVSESGVTGMWTVRLVYNVASGTLNFRADKTT